MLNVIALLVAAVVTPVYTNSYTKGGVTYSQLGGIKSSNYVATAVSFEMPSNIVNSVNGKTGEVELAAEDVGSLPIGGGTMTGSIVLGDNTHLKSYFGTNVIWYANGEIWGWNDGDDYGHAPSFKLTYPQRDGELAVTSDIPPPYTPDPTIVKIGTNGMETIGGYYLSALDFGAVPISGGFVEDIRLKGAFEFGPFAYMHIQREPLDDEHDETYFYLDHFVRKYRPQGGGSAPIETFSIFLPEKSGTLAVGSDIPTSLSSLAGDSTHRLVTDAEKTTWNGKQNAISDLSEIRAGATAGSTAVQRGGDTMTGKLTVSTGNDTTTGFRARMNDNNWIEYKSGNIHVRRGTISGTRIFTFPDTGGILATREEPHLAVINGELHIITEHDTESIYE